MMKRFSKQRLTVIILIIMSIAVTLSFIFLRSAKNREESMNESSDVSGAVKPIVDPENKIPQETFIHYLRKAAHFSEFALLGCEIIALFAAVNTELTLGSYFFSLLISMFFAVCDETVQIFSERGSLVSDIWIDFSGSFMSVTLFLILYSVIRLLRSRKINKTKRRTVSDIGI